MPKTLHSPLVTHPYIQQTPEGSVTFMLYLNGAQRLLEERRVLHCRRVLANSVFIPLSQWLFTRPRLLQLLTSIRAYYAVMS